MLIFTPINLSKEMVLQQQEENLTFQYFTFFSGKDINITHKLDANRVKQKYLKSMGRLRKDQEDLWGHYYVSVCELKPSKPDGNSHFVKMMNYLGRHDCVSNLTNLFLKSYCLHFVSVVVNNFSELFSFETT